jgi:flavin-binding protein dodecin
VACFPRRCVAGRCTCNFALQGDAARGQLSSLEESAVSVYRVTDLIGTSSESWQDAATAAVNVARKTLRDLRVAEVVEQDIHIDEGGALTYRTKLRVSFKYESEE